MSHLKLTISSLLLFCFVTGGPPASAADRPLSPPCFGYAIAAYRDLLVVSAPHVNNGGGQAYLFRREAKTHRLLKVVKRPTQWGKNMFGKDLVLDRKALVIGDSGASAGFTAHAGAVYLFDMPKPGEPFDKPQRIGPPKPERLAGFGESLALHGNLLAIGESSRNDGGSVTLLRRGEDRWERISTLNAARYNEGTTLVGWYGKSVDLNATTLVVGAPFTVLGDKGKGAVFVYQKNDKGDLVDAPARLAWKSGNSDFFGHDVALGEGFLLVGALLADVGRAEDAGAVCLYVRDARGRFPAEPTKVFTAAEPKKEEGFGATLALAGGRLLIGTGTPAGGESSVYVFEPVADKVSNWKQVARLKGADADAGFGSWGLAGTDSLIYVGEPYSLPYGARQGQVAVFARGEKEGRVIFRRIETIKMP